MNRFGNKIVLFYRVAFCKFLYVYCIINASVFSFFTSIICGLFAMKKKRQFYIGVSRDASLDAADSIVFLGMKLTPHPLGVVLIM